MGAPVSAPLHQTIRDAYLRLTHDQRVLFLSIRGLSVDGSDQVLAQRLADHDYACYGLSSQLNSSLTGIFNASCTIASLPPAPPACSAHQRSQERRHPTLGSKTPPRSVSQLPMEIVADIVDHLEDWELSKALGLPTSLSRPAAWDPALGRVSRTDWAILTAPLSTVRRTCAADDRGPTKRGSVIAVRFARVKVLHHILLTSPAAFERDFGVRAKRLPALASVHGRVDVLEWWRGCDAILVKDYDAEPLDSASRAGHVHVLQWWAASGLPLHYTEAALEHASASGHVAVLDWWARSGLPLKIGRVLDSASAAGRTDALEWWRRSGRELKYGASALMHASVSGHIDVLEWWAQSGLQMLFDQDALTGATKHNRPAVLDWWDRSGLPIPYRICDIEEALEDAIGNPDEVRKWWAEKGLNVHANDAEWARLRTLN
ncbi:hypothetical protein BKA62DRAFT_691519 [Auriculariales sp. MPI-PUGE-AT-0066]|nr:hypothetical protein BKA62DRAFT_691519 [Auriculariales sp. MPI-PUGE-AT-0066]